MASVSTVAQFYSTLKVEEVAPGRWRLTQPLRYGDLLVPAGFETDLATTPRLLWPLFPPFGAYDRAAVVHDYLLAHDVVWSDAAMVFRQACVAGGTHKRTAWFLWACVVVWGQLRNL